MLRHLFAAICFCGAFFLTPGALADTTNTPLGTWIRADGQTVFIIETCSTGLCGRIAGYTVDHLSDPAPRDWRGLPLCGETIIAVAPEYGMRNRWHGSILNPKNGNVWQATLTLVNGMLQLRGYFGVPLFGQTETWTRYSGQIGAHCVIPGSGQT